MLDNHNTDESTPSTPRDQIISAHTIQQNLPPDIKVQHMRVKRRMSREVGINNFTSSQ
jgi:hypothetical protein